MMKKAYINEHLAKVFCYRCGTSLEDAKSITLSEVPVALITHITCPKCQAESMVTITAAGDSVMPVISDLTGVEIKKFLAEKSVSYNELLDLHQMLEKESICKLLQKQEKNSAKKQKVYGKKEKSHR